MLLAALLAMAVIVGVLGVMARQAADDIRSQAEIDFELSTQNQLLVALLNAETGQRGYLLTNRADYLEPYKDAVQQLEALLQALQIHADSADQERDPQRRPALARMRELVGLKLAELAQSIRLHDSGDHQAAMALILSNQGQQHMDALRKTLAEMQSELQQERALVSDRLSHDASDTKLFLLIGLAALTLFATLALWQLLGNARQLRSAEERIRAIADNVPALITQFDREGKLIFVNAHVGKVYGIDPQSLLGSQVAEVRGEEMTAELQPHIDRVMRGESVEFESHATIAGRLHHFNQSYVPDIGADGEVQGFLSVSMDISEAKACEQRLRAIADNLPMLISYVDDQLCLQSVNATFKEWVGIDPASVRGRPLLEIIGPVLFAQRVEQLKRALAGERVQFELCSEALGRTRHIQNTYIPHVQIDGRVVGIYALSMDITAMKLAQQQLSELARADALTGLPNRRQFDERLTQALARARREGSALALLFLDIDHFKTINDSHGHAAGDQVLQEFATRLLRCVRSTDLAARLAGDEFVILLEGLNQGHEATAVAGKILMAMRAAIPVGATGLALQVSTSIGVALTPPDALADCSAQTLLARADLALYQAKREGRNRYAAA
ncbi:hypothetical protein BH11PSE10_BH11PSE10_15970 [soil metagenome]